MSLEEKNLEEELTSLACIQKVEDKLLGMCREAREKVKEKEEEILSFVHAVSELWKLFRSSSSPSETLSYALQHAATKRSQELQRMRDMEDLLPDLEREIDKCQRARNRFSEEQEGLEDELKKRKKKARRLFFLHSKEKVRDTPTPFLFLFSLILLTVPLSIPLHHSGGLSSTCPRPWSFALCWSGNKLTWPLRAWTHTAESGPCAAEPPSWRLCEIRRAT